MRKALTFGVVHHNASKMTNAERNGMIAKWLNKHGFIAMVCIQLH